MTPLHGNCPPHEGILGHMAPFKRDPLGFLSYCADHYNGVVRLRMLHRPVFLLMDPADVERVLVTEHTNFIKPAWLRTPAVRRLLGNGLVTSEGETWRKQRHTCKPAFEQRRMERYGDAISAITSRALANWKPGQTIDIMSEMSRLTMEIVGSLFFQTSSEDRDWIAEGGEAMDAMMVRFTASRNLFGMIPLPPGLAEMKAARRLDSVVDLLIDGHNAAFTNGLDAAANDPDLLSLLKECGSAEHHEDADRLLREQVKTFLTAGHESSAIAVSWVFVLLSSHPAAEGLLHRELANVLGDSLPTYSDLRSLSYTQAVVSEALRLYPPLWMTGRQSIHSCVIGGAAIPAGALVMTSQWVLHRLPKLFDEPDVFRPERWLNGETSGLPRCAYIPFGAGPRTCIGLGFAMMESTLLLAAIAQRFRLVRTDRRDIQPWATMTLRPPPGTRMQLQLHT